MMKKQKIMLYRIIAAAVIYVPLFVLEHMGKLEFQSEIPVQFLLFMIPYLIVGHHLPGCAQYQSWSGI